MARQLRLSNRQAWRSSLVKLIREFDQLDEPTGGDVHKFKALVYAMQTLLSSDKADSKLVERIEKLEAKL